MLQLEGSVSPHDGRVPAVPAGGNKLSRLQVELGAAVRTFDLRNYLRQDFFTYRSRILLIKAEISSLRPESKTWRDSGLSREP